MYNKNYLIPIATGCWGSFQILKLILSALPAWGIELLF